MIHSLSKVHWWWFEWNPSKHISFPINNQARHEYTSNHHASKKESEERGEGLPKDDTRGTDEWIGDLWKSLSLDENKASPGLQLVVNRFKEDIFRCLSKALCRSWPQKSTMTTQGWFEISRKNRTWRYGKTDHRANQVFVGWNIPGHPSEQNGGKSIR